MIMADLEGKILNAFDDKSVIWWRLINDIFPFENSFYLTIKFTAKYSKETTNVSDVNIRLEGESS